MADLDITVKLDPNAAAAGAKKVADEVSKTEQAANRAKQAYATLGDVFRQIGGYQARLAEEAGKARQAVDNLGTSFRNLSQAIGNQMLSNTARQFDSLTEAIRREQRILEQIHGPARRYADDLQVLDSLLDRNKISTREYADQVSRLNTQLASSRITDTGIARGQDLLGAESGDKLSNISKGIGGLNFKQAASGAREVFSRLNSELDLMNNNIGRVIGRTAEFGATGAQIAGPWGAAAGAVVGFTVSKIKGLTDAEAETRKLSEEQEKLAKEYHDGVAAAKLKASVELQLASAMAAHAEEAERLSQREETRAEVMNASSEALREASDRSRAYADLLFKVNSALAVQISLTNKLYGGDPTASTPQTADESTSVTAGRGLRDATIDAYAADKSYGATLIRLSKDVNALADEQENLAQIMGDINVPIEVQKKAFDEYTKNVKKSQKSTKDLSDETKNLVTDLDRLRAALHITGISDAQFSAVSSDLAEIDRAIRAEAGLRVFGAPTAGAFSPSSDLSLSVDDATKINEAQNAAARYQATVDDLANNSMASLKQAAQSVGDALVDAFMDGRLEADKLLDSLSRMLLKGAVNNLIGFGFAQLGGGATGFDSMVGGGRGPFLPGFATGGDMMVGGAGGTDSRIAAFRVTPGESIHVRTPQQRSEMAQAARGGNVKIVNQIQDRRSILQNLDDDRDFDHIVLNVLQRHQLT